jgi:hypothetical protein
MAEPRLSAGAATALATPPIGTPLAGSFYPRASTGVEDELRVRAVVISSGATTAVLAVCDVVYVAGETVREARAEIQRRIGVPASHVMVSATHTHSGPYTIDMHVTPPDTTYTALLARRIADAVVEAYERRQPARIAVGASAVDGVCFNRRYLMRDGTVHFNPGAGNPEVVRPAGPVDPTVTGLLVETLDGAPIALWANLSLHYVGTDGDGLISPDYYGHFARVVRDWLGPDVVGVLSNGASGDINNVDLDRAVTTRGAARARQVARAVAGAAIAATGMRRRSDRAVVEAESIPFTVSYREFTAADIALAREIAASERDEDLPDRDFSFVVGQRLPSAMLTRYYAAVVLRRADDPPPAETEVQVIRVGDLAIAGFPGEMFVEFGLDLKDRSPAPFTAAVGMANDCHYYLPTRRAYAEGGYETWGCRTVPGTGEAMVDAAVHRLIDRARSAPYTDRL